MPNSVRQVRFSEILQHADLLAEYAAECSIPAIGPISPQPQIYELLENSGVMQCFGTFHVEQMIGFGNVLMTVMPHYGRKLATIESLFVSKGHRSTGAGLELMQAIEKHVAEEGCEGIFYSSPAGGKLERLLERRKQYQRTNAVFFRSL